MKLFTDLNGREWEIKLTIGTVKKLNERLQPLEADLRNPSSLLVRMEDPFFMADLLYLACKDQADARGITSEQFGEGLAGEVFCQAKTAFTTEYINFFPDRTVRMELLAAREHAEKMQIAARGVLKAKMEEIEAEMLDKLKNGKMWPDTPDLPDSSITNTSPGGNSI